MALGFPLPQRLLVHSHWTVKKKKMSKSVGNVVNPFEAMGTYGTDAARYFLARAGGRFKHDVGTSLLRHAVNGGSSHFTTIDWSRTQFAKHSTELMSLVGNFYSRVTAEKLEILLRSSPKPTIIELQAAVADGKQVLGSEILVQLGELQKRTQERMQDLDVGDAVQEVVDVLTLVSLEHHPPRDSVVDSQKSLRLQANKIYSEAQPWLPSANDSHRAQIHAISVETLRICGILLQPFIPEKSVELLEALGTKPEERTWDYAKPGKGATGNFKRGIRLFVDPGLRK